MIKCWSFEFNNVHTRNIDADASDPAVAQRAFDRNMDRLVKLEDAGFVGVFFSEHHFVESLCSSPNLLIAAIAQRTKKMRLGVMGNVLPFHQPWRIAEELGMLDYITHGRLEIGFAPGIPPEYLFLDMPQEEIRPRFQEILDFLENAFENKYATHKGRFWNFDGIPTMPRLRNETRRRKWLTVYSPESCEMAARRGYKICTGFRNLDEIKGPFDAYRAEADRAGQKVSADDIGLRRQVLIWDTDAAATELHTERLQIAQQRALKRFAPVDDRLKKRLAAIDQSGIKASGVMDAATPARDPRKPAAPNYLSMRDEFIYGKPATVAEIIIDQCRQIGAGNFMPYHSVALEDSEVDHHNSFWPQVVAILNKADVMPAVA